MTAFSILSFILAATVAVAIVSAVWRDSRRSRPALNPGFEIWKREFDARNPPGPAFDDAERAAFAAFRADRAQPAVTLSPDPARPIAATGSRVGGPVWLADGEDWPCASSGMPLEFVAQLDFAELPPLPGLPERGVLQFFVGDDDTFGADFDEPDRGSARLLWRQELAGGRMHAPPPLDDEAPDAPRRIGSSPFCDRKLRRRGIALVPGAVAVEPLPSTDWRVDAYLEGQLGREGIDELLESGHQGAVRGHKVGGQPSFTQFDFRKPDHGAEYDTLLLGLTSDDVLMWGDVGEASFLIPRAALEAKDFSRAIFYWDCT